VEKHWRALAADHLFGALPIARRDDVKLIGDDDGVVECIDADAAIACALSWK
jgi:hypothetical protein